MTVFGCNLCILGGSLGNDGTDNDGTGKWRYFLARVNVGSHCFYFLNHAK